MRLRAALLGGVLACALLLFAVGRLWLHSGSDDGSQAAEDLPLVTPPGILLLTQNGSERARIETAVAVFFADAHGMALYTHGTSPCDAACEVLWPPALAPTGAVAQGDFSLLAHGTATQWAYRGAALHRHASDTAPSEITGEPGGDWYLAVLRPGDGLPRPAGIEVRETPDAAGIALVDGAGMTLYRAPVDLGTWSSHWTPLAAPAIANPTGDFKPLAREDGITQWTYQGHLLFRYDGDRQPGDANGMDVDPAFTIALVARLFVPAGVRLRRDLELGTVWVTEQDQTLYQRDRVVAGEERHPFRSDHGAAQLGRFYGVSTCDATCARAWPPLAAPADASPSGYWEVLTRADGTHQWAYKGFALYTRGDEPPGATRGNQVYAFASVGSDAPDQAEFAPPPGSAPGTGLGALFWHAVIP
jgi:predicted lipoprotein with Yx(FWY)xxD motif